MKEIELGIKKDKFKDTIEGIKITNPNKLIYNKDR